MLKLHEYQIRGAEFWINNPRTYFAVDMGLGKTAIVLHALTKIKKPALIIAPLRPVYTTWPEEISKWGFNLSYTIIHGPNKLEAFERKTDVYITNFESIPFVYDTLVFLVQNKKPIPFEVCIIDEGSMIKSHRTKRHKYFEAIRKVFPKYRAILSGTPAPNSLLDLWSQYYFLCDGDALFERFSRYRVSYFNADKWNPYTYTIKPKADTKIYKRIAPYTFRLDEKDYIKLPEITYNYVNLDLPKKLNKQYKELKKEFILSINNIECKALNAASLSLKLRQFLQGFLYYFTDEVNAKGEFIRFTTEIHNLKLKALENLVNETGQPILCAIQFKHELDMIRRIYPEVPIIAGGTKNSDSLMYIQQWNRRQLPLLLCHPASISHGVNLQSGGNIIIWYCLTWSLEQYQQFNKRIHRQGQKKGVVINHLTINNTIDSRVAEVLAHKNITQQALLDYLKDLQYEEMG